MEVQSLSLDHTVSLDSIMHLDDWYSVVLSIWREVYPYMIDNVDV
jgi:hypothetical protein